MAIRHDVRFAMKDKLVRRILYLYLNFHPYEIQMVKSLNLGYYLQRIQFNEDILKRLNHLELYKPSNNAFGTRLNQYPLICCERFCKTSIFDCKNTYISIKVIGKRSV